MGIYSANRYSSLGTDVEIVAAEGYHGEIGAAVAMLEGYQNDMALFNGIIAADFQEACLVQEGASAEEVYVLQEGALKGAWEKIKQFFIKLGEKIKGIFKAFIAKMDSIFMKDANAFYKKYEKDIQKKDTFDGLKIKCRTLKVDPKNIALGFDAVDHFLISASEDAKKANEDFDAEEAFSEEASNRIDGFPKNIEKKDFEKEYYDIVFNEEEEKDDWKSSDFTGGWVAAILQDKKTLSTIEEANKKTEQAIKNIIGEIEKLEKEIDKVKDTTGQQTYNGKVNVKADRSAPTNYIGQASIGDMKQDRFKSEINDWQTRYQIAHKRAVVTQDVFNAYAATSIKAYKEACAQARKIYAAAVAFTPAKSEATLAAALGDVAYYEAVDLMDTMYAIEA